MKSHGSRNESSSSLCNVGADPVHLGTTEFQQVDKILVAATQLVPLSEPRNGPLVRNSQKMMY